VVTDELGLFNERPASRTRSRPPQGRRGKRKSRRRTTIWVSVLIILALIGFGAWYGITHIFDFGYDDYSGPGEQDVIVEVSQGASTGEIASILQQQGVVASTKAFVKAAGDDSRVRGIQPGFYQLKTHVSGKTAVGEILDPKARKGNLQIKAGSQLEDVKKLDGSVEPGIVQRLSTASCADLNGKSTCVSVADLRKVAATEDLAKLGVPDWAAPVAAKLEPNRRLEGLVFPGVYDVKPGSSAEDLWRKVLTESAAQLQSIGMPKSVADTGFTPYQVLTMASLIEREGIQGDFGKISRVTYNRLAKQMKLEYDSTVNYVLDSPAVRTKPEDRARAGAYNTYENTGLTPGPISSPSKAAILAATSPEPGPWLFFVRCQKDGASCFAETAKEHEQNVKQAQANGAY
jgi:UPF0755 protein